MDEHISREAVNNIFDQACTECKEACLEFDGFMPDCDKCLLHTAKSQFKTIPAADVRPVVRGKWEFRSTDAIASKAWTCSVCGRRKVFKTNFCPQCGADMRGSNLDATKGDNHD